MNPTRILFLAVTLVLTGGHAQAQQCLHGENETAAEKERRTLALNAVRFINTAEIFHYSKLGKFVTWEHLVNSSAMQEMRERGMLAKTGRLISLDAAQPILPGFTLRLTTNGEKYSLLLRDETDPCKFSFFSDQEGVAYYGQPIDYPPSAALFKPE